jgi:hypothetical protein
MRACSIGRTAEAFLDVGASGRDTRRRGRHEPIGAGAQSDSRGSVGHRFPQCCGLACAAMRLRAMIDGLAGRWPSCRRRFGERSGC